MDGGGERRSSDAWGRRWLTFGLVSQQDEAGIRIIRICLDGSQFRDRHDVTIKAEQAIRRGFVMLSQLLIGSPLSGKGEVRLTDASPWPWLLSLHPDSQSSLPTE